MSSVEEALKATLAINFMWQDTQERRNIPVVVVGKITGQAVRLKSVKEDIRVFTSGTAHFAATGVIRGTSL